MEIINFIGTLYLIFYFCTLINADKVVIPSGRILNGDEVTDCATYPWFAHIFSESGIDCGGTLISDKFVVTAAHCTDTCTAGQYFFVDLGSITVLEGQEHDGELVACHPDYSYSISYDIAIIKLAAPIAITECIDYVSILDKRDFIEEDLPVKAIGFGITETIDAPTTLQEAVFLRTMSQQECEKDYGFLEGSLDPNLCTNSYRDGQSTCTADSGGGLFFDDDGLRPVLIGVIIAGPFDCQNSIYAKVYHPLIFDWIMDMTDGTVNYVAIHPDIFNDTMIQ